MDNIKIHKGEEWGLPRFEKVFNLEVELCKYSITDIYDISKLGEQYQWCIDNQDNKSSEKKWIDKKILHEGAAITILNRMKLHYETMQKGALLMDLQLRERPGTNFFTAKGAFHSAINGKTYLKDEYDERLKEYNLKRGLQINSLDYDGDLSAEEIDRACSGLKTYKSEDIFDPNLFKKVKIGFKNLIEMEVPENAE